MPFKTEESKKEYQKKWRAENKEKIIADRKKYKESGRWKIVNDKYKKTDSYKISRKKYSKANSDRFRLERKKRKDDCYTAMGGKCVECGFNDYRALQIDHINGDGKKERHLLSRNDYYPNVLKSFLAGKKRYQLLCCNCNWIKREINGEYRKKSEQTGQINH